MGDIIPFPISSASHMHMKALITDICATVFTLELKADEAEQALIEILSNHKEILFSLGVKSAFDCWRETSKSQNET